MDTEGFSAKIIGINGQKTSEENLTKYCGGIFSSKVAHIHVRLLGDRRRPLMRQMQAAGCVPTTTMSQRGRNNKQ